MTELEPGGYQTLGNSCHGLLAVSACKGLQKLEFSRDSLNLSLFFFLLLLLLFPQSWLSAWLFCIATSSSRPFWVKLGSCEYLLISCLEGIWIFNHYYHPLSSLFYCIYVVLLVWLMFLWSDGKEGPNLKDFTVYLWDEQHRSHSTIWELMGSTRITKPEEKEVSFRAYYPLNFLSVYWLDLALQDCRWMVRPTATSL